MFSRFRNNFDFTFLLLMTTFILTYAEKKTQIKTYNSNQKRNQTREELTSFGRTHFHIK